MVFCCYDGLALSIYKLVIIFVSQVDESLFYDIHAYNKKDLFSPKFLLNFNNVENEVLQQEVILFVRMLLPVIVPLLMDIITQLVLPVILKYRP